MSRNLSIIQYPLTTFKQNGEIQIPSIAGFCRETYAKLYFEYTGGEALGVRQRSFRLCIVNIINHLRRQLRCRTPRRPSGASYPHCPNKCISRQKLAILIIIEICVIYSRRLPFSPPTVPYLFAVQLKFSASLKPGDADPPEFER
jgi:hypothetical protein